MIPLHDSQKSSTTPVVVIVLIAINIAVFLFEMLLDEYSRNHFVATYGLVTARFQVADLVTHMFLHSGWMHLIGNMWFLWVFGDNVEDVLGHWKFLAFYLGCGLAAAAAQAAFTPATAIPMVGASGAIAGVMGAYLIKFPSSRVTTLVPFFFLFTFDFPAIFILLYWFGLQLVSGVGSVAEAHLARGGVAWWAHIGGFVAGMIVILVAKTHDPYRHRRDLYW